MTAAIEITDLVKQYGATRALDGLDLSVPTGSVFGFLGGNGAGKTTTLRILTHLAKPTSGSVRVLGGDPGDSRIRARIGFCPDVAGFWPWMTAKQVMETVGELSLIPAATRRRRTAQLLELVSLADVPGKIGGYSRGMRQRLGLAQALLPALDLLLLDEPTSALDPVGRRVVLDLLAQLRGRTTVLFSTHLLGDVERVCDTVAILDRGQVVRAGPVDQVRSSYRGAATQLVVRVDDPVRLRDALAGETWVHESEITPENDLTLDVSDVEVAALRLPVAIANLGLRLHRMEPRDVSLEDAFIDVVGARR